MPAKTDLAADVAIVGAGIAGIATAYYLHRTSRKTLLLIDSRAPMSYTSAQSGDNYRNWWPHSTMTALTNDSIDELERLAKESADAFRMTRGGYLLATRRRDIDGLVSSIPGGIDVDVIGKADGLNARFPALGDDIRHVIHIRRGGDISGQQLGQYLLEQMRGERLRRVTGEVVGLSRGSRYRLDVRVGQECRPATAEALVIAAGPFAATLARMLDVELPLKNVFQQKIAFEDSAGAVPRSMPFSIDLDAGPLDWTDEERALLLEDPSHSWLAGTLPGGRHCRPEGGPNGKWVKLGWAYNTVASTPQQELANEPAIDPQFPEIVIRGAAAFIPALQHYVAAPPSRISHYGGYYTMTDENWPLIGPLDDSGAYIVGAMSGFGSMAACAAGKLCAAYINGSALPGYAADLRPDRLNDAALMRELGSSTNKGLL